MRTTAKYGLCLYVSWFYHGVLKECFNDALAVLMFIYLLLLMACTYLTSEKRDLFLYGLFDLGLMQIHSKFETGYSTIEIRKWYCRDDKFNS